MPALEGDTPADSLGRLYDIEFSETDKSNLNNYSEDQKPITFPVWGELESKIDKGLKEIYSQEDNVILAQLFKDNPQLKSIADELGMYEETPDIPNLTQGGLVYDGTYSITKTKRLGDLEGFATFFHNNTRGGNQEAGNGHVLTSDQPGIRLGLKNSNVGTVLDLVGFGLNVAGAINSNNNYTVDIHQNKLRNNHKWFMTVPQLDYGGNISTNRVSQLEAFTTYQKYLIEIMGE